jgi:hypothetical protein
MTAAIVGCSHPGIEAIVAGAAAINPRIRMVAGGFHLVTAQDSAIDKVVAALHDTFKVERIAPGHCSGEYTFSAVTQIFGIDINMQDSVPSWSSAPRPTPEFVGVEHALARRQRTSSPRGYASWMPSGARPDSSSACSSPAMRIVLCFKA